MPRLTRHPLTICAAASLVPCVAACVLWVRSYFVHDRVCYQTDEDARGVQRYFEVGWNRGAFHFDHNHIRGLGRALAEELGLHAYHDEPGGEPFAPNPYTIRGLPGFGFRPPVTEHPTPATWWHYHVQIPHYAVALASAALPAACAWRFRRRPRAQPAHPCCPVCGYDLRATPDRCPECGTLTGAPGGPSPRATKLP